MIRKILNRITDRLPARFINDGDRPYLERYYLCTMLGWRFYLHQFVGDDPDRGLHDHPWTRAYSIILAGWYIEETRSGKRPVKRFNSLTGDTFHRVVLPSSDTVWTLFFHRVGRAKPWGFLRDHDTTAAPRGTQVFTPYQYTREGPQHNWWLTAPKGRDVRSNP